MTMKFGKRMPRYTFQDSYGICSKDRDFTQLLISVPEHSSCHIEAIICVECMNELREWTRIKLEWI